MKFVKKIFQLLVISLLAISCATINHESINPVDKLDKSTFEQLNGRYSNDPEDGSGRIYRSLNNSTEYRLESLWSNIDQYQIGSRTDWENQTVDIEFLTDKKIVLKLYQQDSLIKKRKLRGKFKDGYFYQRQSIIVVPLIPVLFGYNTHRLRIGTADNYLVVDYKWNVWMSFLIAGHSERGYSSLVFARQ